MILGYQKVRILILQNAIPDFQQLASDIGRTNLATDMGMNPKTLRRRVNDPGEWTIAELAKLSELLKIDRKVLLELADRLSAEIEVRRAMAKKKKGKK